MSDIIRRIYCVITKNNTAEHLNVRAFQVFFVNVDDFLSFVVEILKKTPSERIRLGRDFPVACICVKC